MKNKTAKEIFNTYKLFFALICIGIAAALAVLIYITSISMLIGIAGIILLASNVKTLFFKLEEKTLESVIFDELDPEKFNELIELGAFKNSLRHKILAAVSLGKHKKALELIASYNPKVENPVEICNNLYRKGYVYFELEQYDKLPSVLSEFESLKAKHPKFATIFNNYSVFDKFDAFVDDDFEYVVGVCDIDLKEINTKKPNYKMTKINVSFYRAVSLYKMGNLEEARKGFEEIIAFAPKMHKAKLSADFIKRIENNQ